MTNTKRAFTLVETIIVIAVIGVLAAILIVGISFVNEKANVTSAMSDARNAIKSYTYEKTSDSIYYENLVLVVEKAEKYYVFGYNCYSDDLYECAGNPFKLSSPDTVMKTLADDNNITTQNAGYEDITENIPDILASTYCYGGCRLEYVPDDVVLYDDYIYVPVGYGYDTDGLVMTHTEDDSIVSFSDGKIYGKTKGQTAIRAKAADGEKIIRVTVDDYTDFSGSAKELKSLIESESEYTFIRLEEYNTVGEHHIVLDTDLSEAEYPICIPKGKTVIIDMNAASIFMGNSDKADGSIFNNKGGRFIVFSDKESNTMNEFECLGDDVNPSYKEDFSFIRSESGYTMFSGIKIYSDIAHKAITNVNGKMVIHNTSIGGSDQHTSIENCENGILDISDSEISNYDGFCIENKGQIQTITNSNISAGRCHTAVMNYGTINTVQGTQMCSVFEMKETVENDTACLIMNDGSKIDKMLDCTITAKIQDWETPTASKIYAVILRGNAKITESKNNEFMGIDGTVYNAE